MKGTLPPPPLITETKISTILSDYALNSTLDNYLKQADSTKLINYVQSQYGVISALTTSTDLPLNWPTGFICSFVYSGSVSFYCPSTYGVIWSFHNGSGEASQLWFTQASGTVYHRQGNSAGWSGGSGGDTYGWVALS